MILVRFVSIFKTAITSALISGFLIAAGGPLAKAQTAKPGAAKSTTTTRRTTTEPPLPKNIPPVAGPVKTEFALRYQEIKAGTGDLATPGWVYSVHYTGWLASDGTKFDSSVDRGTPIEFQQGVKRVITGWDQGFDGMHVGGKRRLFIPYQLAYGENGRPPVIPAKADLIFDVELVAQRDPYAPVQPQSQPSEPPPSAAPPATTPKPQ
jgi:peptidylprolyl isomerase